VAGVLLLAAFLWIETRVPDPLFHLALFKIRMFAAGNVSGFLSSLARGGLQFMLMIWLQGIWLPLHGYAYQDTPLWAGIYTMPMMLGFIGLGPVSGWLSDRYGARAFATGGMAITAIGFVLLNLMPGDFNRWVFFAILLLMGCGMGLFAAPNTTSIMNSVPAEVRGVASGMRGTFQNAGMMVSMAVFFTILTAGLEGKMSVDVDHRELRAQHFGLRHVQHALGLEFAQVQRHLMRLAGRCWTGYHWRCRQFGPRYRCDRAAQPLPSTPETHVVFLPEIPTESLRQLSSAVEESQHGRSGKIKA